MIRQLILIKNQNPKIWNYNSPIREVTSFLMITLVAHFLYRRYSEILFELEIIQKFQSYLQTKLFDQAGYFLKLLIHPELREHQYIFENKAYLSINPSCAGIKQIYQTTILLILSGGSRLHKIWYIPTSLFIIHFSNVARIIFLGICMQYFSENWQFIHDWIARPFFYLIIFIIWSIWVKINKK